MFPLAIAETSSFVNRISLGASVAWQVSVSRSPSISEERGSEDIVTVVFFFGFCFFFRIECNRDKCYSHKFFIGD